MTHIQHDIVVVIYSCISHRPPDLFKKLRLWETKLVVVVLLIKKKKEAQRNIPCRETPPLTSTAEILAKMTDYGAELLKRQLNGKSRMVLWRIICRWGYELLLFR